MKIIKAALVALALTLFCAVFASGVQADQWNKSTVLTFSQPFEIPGQVLPAGTYTFQLLNSDADRHIVQIFNEDGTRLITTVLAINNYRLVTSSETVIKFAERSGDNPEALKAWFYPGDEFGQEFVYPKERAIELAVASNEPVPALAIETTDLKTAPIVAVTPEQKEVPVAEAIQTAPPVAMNTDPAPMAGDTDPAPVATAQELPQTAGLVPLIALLGLASLGCAIAVKRFAIQES